MSTALVAATQRQGLPLLRAYLGYFVDQELRGGLRSHTLVGAAKSKSLLSNLCRLAFSIAQRLTQFLKQPDKNQTVGY